MNIFCKMGPPFNLVLINGLCCRFTMVRFIYIDRGKDVV